MCLLAPLFWRLGIWFVLTFTSTECFCRYGEFDGSCGAKTDLLVFLDIPGILHAYGTLLASYFAVFVSFLKYLSLTKFFITFISFSFSF